MEYTSTLYLFLFIFILLRDAFISFHYVLRVHTVLTNQTYCDSFFNQSNFTFTRFPPSKEEFNRFDSPMRNQTFPIFHWRDHPWFSRSRNRNAPCESHDRSWTCLVPAWTVTRLPIYGSLTLASTDECWLTPLSPSLFSLLLCLSSFHWIRVMCPFNLFVHINSNKLQHKVSSFGYWGWLCDPCQLI